MKKINKSFSLFIMMLCASLMFVSMPARAASDPVNMLNSIADQLISKLKANKATLKTNRSYVYSLANQIVVPHAAVDEMAKRVLPPQTWNHATASERSQFSSQFTTLLVHTYASALADYNDQTIHFYPVRGGYDGKNTVQVNSNIERTDGPEISVNYKLVLRGSQWKLYDMSVEGVSMLESFRSQFADSLAKGDMQSLIRDLRAHNSGGRSR
ncbi:MAG: ABC transporter substrate-binding protein [Gammaproteobacteria bacterium]|nr:ABC transporter substrate-binding protein [Gammaproteobacteria bacterium]